MIMIYLKYGCKNIGYGKYVVYMVSYIFVFFSDFFFLGLLCYRNENIMDVVKERKKVEWFCLVVKNLG